MTMYGSIDVRRDILIVIVGGGGVLMRSEQEHNHMSYALPGIACLGGDQEQSFMR